MVREATVVQRAPSILTREISSPGADFRSGNEVLLFRIRVQLSLNLEFEWDAPKAAANVAKHKVSLVEAATVFSDPLGRIVTDPRHSVDEYRFVLLGLAQSNPGCNVHLRGQAIRIIRARSATRRKRKNYEKVIN